MNLNEFSKIVSLYRKSAPIVIVCVGSTKILSDCFGPIVGHILCEKHNLNAYVYGTLASPINAVNLISSLEEIKQRHEKSKIICVDSFEPRNCTKDEIRFINGPIKPGLASGKNLPPVGDVSIISASAKTKSNSYCLGKIYALASITAKIIDYSLR